MFSFWNKNILQWLVLVKVLSIVVLCLLSILLLFAYPGVFGRGKPGFLSENIDEIASGVESYAVPDSFQRQHAVILPVGNSAASFVYPVFGQESVEIHAGHFIDGLRYVFGIGFG